MKNNIKVEVSKKVDNRCKRKFKNKYEEYIDEKQKQKKYGLKKEKYIDKVEE